jgi:hypothetical protein
MVKTENVRPDCPPLVHIAMSFPTTTTSAIVAPRKSFAPRPARCRWLGQNAGSPMTSQTRLKLVGEGAQREPNSKIGVGSAGTLECLLMQPVPVWLQLRAETLLPDMPRVGTLPYRLPTKASSALYRECARHSGSPPDPAARSCSGHARRSNPSADLPRLPGKRTRTRELVSGLLPHCLDGRGDAGAKWPRKYRGKALSAALPQVRQGGHLEFHGASAGPRSLRDCACCEPGSPLVWRIPGPPAIGNSTSRVPRKGCHRLSKDRAWVRVVLSVCGYRPRVQGISSSRCCRRGGTT